ncbi:ATP-binding cassette transporter [Clonorchis sinensis]|uniref:ATP-binding cassette transporter n=1 Tax=Clonorchis sinensis TaxID=79923 RepID=G7YI92_CLOSI|nr:ATP-binding cassette transporter [Clonorchis sinensis]
MASEVASHAFVGKFEAVSFSSFTAFEKALNQYMKDNYVLPEDVCGICRALLNYGMSSCEVRQLVADEFGKFPTTLDIYNYRRKCRPALSGRCRVVGFFVVADDMYSVQQTVLEKFFGATNIRSVDTSWRPVIYAFVGSEQIALMRIQFGLFRELMGEKYQYYKHTDSGKICSFCIAPSNEFFSHFAPRWLYITRKLAAHTQSGVVHFGTVANKRLENQLNRVVNKLRGLEPRRATAIFKHLMVQGQILLCQGPKSATDVLPSVVENTAPQTRRRSGDTALGFCVPCDRPTTAYGRLDINGQMKAPHEEVHAPPGRTFVLVQTTNKTKLFIWSIVDLLPGGNGQARSGQLRSFICPGCRHPCRILLTVCANVTSGNSPEEGEASAAIKRTALARRTYVNARLRITRTPGCRCVLNAPSRSDDVFDLFMRRWNSLAYTICENEKHHRRKEEMIIALKSIFTDAEAKAIKYSSGGLGQPAVSQRDLSRFLVSKLRLLTRNFQSDLMPANFFGGFAPRILSGGMEITNTSATAGMLDGLRGSGGWEGILSSSVLLNDFGQRRCKMSGFVAVAAAPYFKINAYVSSAGGLHCLSRSADPIQLTICGLSVRFTSLGFRLSDHAGINKPGLEGYSRPVCTSSQALPFFRQKFAMHLLTRGKQSRDRGCDNPGNGFGGNCNEPLTVEKHRPLMFPQRLWYMFGDHARMVTTHWRFFLKVHGFTSVRRGHRANTFLKHTPPVHKVLARRDLNNSVFETWCSPPYPSVTDRIKQNNKRLLLRIPPDFLCDDICCLSETRTQDASTSVALTAPSVSSRFRLRISGDTATAVAGYGGIVFVLSDRLRKTRTPHLAVKKLIDSEIKRTHQLLGVLPDGPISDTTDYWKRYSKLGLPLTAEKLEDVKNAGNVQRLFYSVRWTHPRKPLVSVTVSAQNGYLIYSQEERLDRWARCFENHLRSAILAVNRNVNLEVSECVSLLKCHRAAVPDNIPPALLKFSGKFLNQCLFGLFGSTWENNTVPDNWDSFRDLNAGKFTDGFKYLKKVEQILLRLGVVKHSVVVLVLSILINSPALLEAVMGVLYDHTQGNAGFIRKGDLMQHQKCGTCLGVDWEKSWDRATNMLATENRGVNRKSSFNGPLNGSYRLPQSLSCMGDEKPSFTPLRKRQLSVSELISPPTKHKLSAIGSTGKKESVKNVVTNTNGVLKTSETDRYNEGSTSITQFSMMNSKSSTLSVGRCSLLDWESFISLPKKRRSLSLKSRSESVVQCKSQVTTSVTPKLNTSLPAAEKTTSLSENCVGELEGTVSQERAEPSSKIEEFMVETIPEIDPDVINSIKKHPKAIAGSTISPSSIISPVLTVHGIVDPRGKERFSPSVLNSSNSGVRLVNSDSLGLSHCTLSRSPVRKKRTWIQSTHSVEFCETSVTEIANSLMPPSKKEHNQEPSPYRPDTDISTRLRTNQADHHTLSSSANETDSSMYSTQIRTIPESMMDSVTSNHRLSNGSQTTESFLDQSKAPAYDSPNDEHIMISKSALRPRKSAGSPSVTACPRCSCTVLHPNGLQRHLKMCKGVLRDTDNEDTLTTQAEPPPPSPPGRPPKAGVLRCPHCNRRFEKACGIVIHVRTCKGADNELSISSFLSCQRDGVFCMMVRIMKRILPLENRFRVIKHCAWRKLARDIAQRFNVDKKGFPRERFEINTAELENLHPVTPEDQLTIQKVEKSVNNIAKLSDIPKEMLPSSGFNRILESDMDSRSRSKLPKPEGNITAQNDSADGEREYRECLLSSVRAAAFDNTASKTASQNTRLRSRSSTPSSQHRASPNSQTTNHRQAEYTCDPEEHFPRMRLRLRLSPREPSSQPSSLKAESPSSEATTLPALPPPTTRWSKKPSILLFLVLAYYYHRHPFVVDSSIVNFSPRSLF